MSNVFGKSGAEKRLAKWKPSDFETAGLSGSFTPRLNRKGKPIKGAFDFSLGRSSGLSDNLDTLSRTFRDQSGAFGDLRGRVSGVIGDLTKARIDAIRRAGSRTVGNLREELGKRRVLGSSFAQDQITRTEAEFGAQEAELASEAQLTEIGLNAELIAQEFGSAIEGFQAVIGQFNFESDLAARVAGAASSLLQANGVAAAEAAAARRSGNAELFTTLLGFGGGGGGGASSGGAPSGGASGGGRGGFY